MKFVYALIVLGPMAHAWLWPLFIGGQVINILKRASDAVRSHTNAVDSRGHYLSLYWDILLYRALVGALLFWCWVVSPDAVTRALANVGVQLNFTIPLIPPVALGFGLVSDVLVEWVFGRFPQLKIVLPMPLPSAPDTQAKNAAAGGQ